MPLFIEPITFDATIVRLLQQKIEVSIEEGERGQSKSNITVENLTSEEMEMVNQNRIILEAKILDGSMLPPVKAEIQLVGSFLNKRIISEEVV